MVAKILKAANLVNNPIIKRIAQKNSAKVARLKLKKEPIPRGSGKCSDLSEKEASLGHPCVSIKDPKTIRSINSAIF